MISGTELGWICRRPLNPMEPATQTTVDEQGAAATYRKTNQKFAGFKGFAVQKLCLQYNLHAVESCARAECARGLEKGAKAAPLFRPACPNPYCELEIPILPTDVTAQSITVAGPSGAGKTHYIVALSDWWKLGLPRLGLSASSAMGESVRGMFEGIRQKIKELKDVADATERGLSVSFSWVIAPAKGLVQEPGGTTRRGILCSLPDVSGEDLLTPEALEANHHFHFSAGVILILDGERIAVAQNLLPPNSRSPDDHLTMIEAMIQDLDSRDETVSKAKRVATPIAVCVNKIDLLAGRSDGLPRRPENDAWRKIMINDLPNHQRAFDYQRSFARSGAIRALLLAFPQTEALVHTLEQNFSSVVYFAMATIGSDVRPLAFRPVSVEDPFLWLLCQLRILATASSPRRGGAAAPV